MERKNEKKSYGGKCPEGNEEDSVRYKQMVYSSFTFTPSQLLELNLIPKQ
jgi:hypothetical protein